MQTYQVIEYIQGKPNRYEVHRAKDALEACDKMRPTLPHTYEARCILPPTDPIQLVQVEIAELELDYWAYNQPSIRHRLVSLEQLLITLKARQPGQGKQDSVR